MEKQSKHEGKTKVSLIKKFFFRLNALEIFAVFVSVLVIIIWAIFRKLSTGGGGPSKTPFIILVLLLLLFNGWAIMNRNGFDFSTIFFYALIVVSGPGLGVLLTLIGATIVFYLWGKSTPFDFLIEKSLIHRITQTVMLLFITIGVWILYLTGHAELAMESFMPFVVIYTLCRIIRVFILSIYGRVPLTKLMISNGTGILLNYYLAKYALIWIINYVASMS